MNINEIKALHEAVYTHYHLLLQYSNRILDGMPDAAMNITKSQEVEQVYDTAVSLIHEAQQRVSLD